ncbi:hypothetical protein FLBR109950_14720 [Flavobacterium branchiophilum]|uniref:Uncharacterized protein n=1 Tax=Flavobacterium branchiophilum (strain FL-15) TaxID=1034807 RepID=G2Z549_FLABF|nr:hypothetical protein [Flavobacterium branchiophilum]CCB68555.1 Probable transmembrane protein of unknown function [Flavobacterium branchiophilum FL-15]
MKENYFKNLLESYTSKTVITLLGIIGTIITIYAFLQEKNVDLKYEIIANTNVLDFNADISKLEVTYDSTNLKQTKENLRIYTIKIINNGSQNLLKEFYDDNEPLGIKINSGKIIEKPQVIETSNEYLKRNIKFINLKENQVSFSKVILETNEYFTIKILVLHNKNRIPKLISLGKIAGQKNIEVLNSISAKDENNFFKKTYYGNLWVQLLRLISYFIIGILIILIVAIIATKIEDSRDEKRKIKLIKDFKDLKNYSYSRMDDAIFDRYQKDDSYAFNNITKLIENENELNDIYLKLSELLKDDDYINNREKIDDYKLQKHLDINSWSTITEMLNDGIIFKENDKLRINQAMKGTLTKFSDFLNEKKEFKKRGNYRSYKSEIEE